MDPRHHNQHHFSRGYLSFWEFLASLEGDPGKCKLETNAGPRGGGE